MKIVYRLLSLLWSIHVERAEGRRGPLYVEWENGRLVLNSTGANQSFGGLHTVWQRAFRAAGVKYRNIGRVLLLGLGGGSAVRILRKEMGVAAPIVAVDDDPEMVRIARRHFHLDRYARVEVIVEDAFVALERLQGPFDLIAVDLFTEMDMPAALLTSQVVDRLWDILPSGGMLMVNTIAHDDPSTEQVARMKALLAAKGPVRTLRPLALNHVLVLER